MIDGDFGDLCLTVLFWVMAVAGVVMTLREVCHLIS